MPQRFSTREVLLLCGFAGALAVADTVSRSSSGCVQCEVDLVERSLEQHEAAARNPAKSPPQGQPLPHGAAANLSR